MKKILFAFTMLLAIAACTNKPVTAVENNEESTEVAFEMAKKIFGDKYDAFQAINSDEKNRERLRADVLATYVKKNGLAVTMYQDYGWPAKKLGD